MRIINQESGRSMTEMIGVIAIIGVLTVGAISAANFGLESYRVAAVANQIELAAEGVTDLYSWGRSYPTEDSTDMRNKICQNHSVFDDDCVPEQTNFAAVMTAWGYLELHADSESQFKIVLTNVPYTACNQLLDTKWANVTLESPSECSDQGSNRIEFSI